MVADGHALAGRKAAHERDDLFDVWIAVTVNEWQAQDAHIEPLHPKKHFLCRELAQRIRIDWIASIVLISETATIVTVRQPGAQENKTPNVCMARGASEMLRSALVDGMRLLRCRAPEESSTVHHCGDPLDSEGKGFRVQKVTLYEFYLVA